jgi:hypothetical protein
VRDIDTLSSKAFQTPLNVRDFHSLESNETKSRHLAAKIRVSCGTVVPQRIPAVSADKKAVIAQRAGALAAKCQ